MPSYDSARRRKAIRRGTERGRWLYVPAEVLETMDRAGDAPLYYRIWPGRRGSLAVRLYRDK